jgi:hypothetical protein
MSVHVYAICDGDAEASPSTGIGAQPLRMVRCGRLAALVSDSGGDAPSGREEELWQHEQAVEALMAGHDVLPMRFGARLADDEAVAVLLRAREGELRRGLLRVAGGIELGIRATPSAPAPERSTGSCYLDGLKRRDELAGELQRRIEHALAPLARDSRFSRPRYAAGTVASAHLVERERLEEFRARAAALAEELDSAALSCTGPWPPYSFAEPGEEA